LAPGWFLAGVWLLVVGVGGTARAALEVGVARVDITPAPAMKAALGGYGERKSRPATGVHDRVWAKALTFQDGASRRAVVTADILAFPPGFREAVADRLGSGWEPAQLLFLASHSHSSLDLMALHPRNVFGIPEMGVFHKELADWLVGRLAEAVLKASETPVAMRAGSAVKPLPGWNRNRRQGPDVDPNLTVTRVDAEDGKPLAVLVNWTAHPTFMDAQHMEFSGDWPGHLQRTMEALIGRGVTVLYYNGAEGDQSPVPRHSGAPAWEQAECYGRELGIEAWRLWEGIQPSAAPVFRWHCEPVSLPPRSAHSDFMRTGGKEYGLTPENVDLLLGALCPETTHCTAMRLGDLVIAGVPGEMAAGLGLKVKADLRQLTGARCVAIGGLADEWISYMLTPEEYRRGGYEASVSFYGETLGPVMVKAAIAAGAGLR
jgi:hypothetical protein